MSHCILTFLHLCSAYEILSDEQKRKNYDLYGDERGGPGPGFDAGDPGQHGGYSYFTSGGPGHDNSRSFSFSFGGSGSGSGFDMGDIFSNFFGGGMGGGSQFGGFGSSGNQFGGFGSSGNQFGGFSSSGRSKAGSRQSSKSIQSVNSQFYRKEIIDNGMTWLLLVYKSNMQEIQLYESLIEEVGSSLQGALKVLVQISPVLAC